MKALLTMREYFPSPDEHPVGIDTLIEKIERRHLKGKYLQNILYALSLGPACRSHLPNDIKICFQTGHSEHPNVLGLLFAHKLIISDDPSGKFNERGSILTETGEKILDHLTATYGPPEWAKKMTETLTPALK